MEDSVCKNYFDNELPKWNRDNGYDIEQVISDLGYEFDSYSQFGCMTKHYVNENGNTAWLELPVGEMHFNPVFHVFAENGERISSVSFRKYLSVGVLVDCLNEDFVQVGDDFEMSYYSSDTILKTFYYKNGMLDYEPLPDEIRHIDTVDPIERINLAYDWVNEIRKNRGLEGHPTLKKIKKHK